MSRKKTGEKRSRLFGKPDALLLDEAAVPGAPSTLPSPEENPATWPKPRVLREGDDPASSPVSAPVPAASFVVPDADPFSLPEPEEESIAAAEADEEELGFDPADADGESTLLDLDFARARQASGASVRLRLGGSVATLPPPPPDDAFYDPDLSNLVETVRTGREEAPPPPAPRVADDGGWDAGGFEEDDEDDAVLPGRPGVAMIRVPPVRSGPPTNPRPVAAAPPPRVNTAPVVPPVRSSAPVSAVLRGPVARPAEPPVRAPAPRQADEAGPGAPMRPGVYAMAMPSAPPPSRVNPLDNRGARPTEPRGGPVSTAPTVIAPALSARALSPPAEPARVRPPDAGRTPAPARGPAPPPAPGPAPTAPPLEPASSTRSLLVGTVIGFALAALVGVMVVQRGNVALGTKGGAKPVATEAAAGTTPADGAAASGTPPEAPPEAATADAAEADAAKADAAEADAARADAARADAARADAAAAKAEAAKADAAKAEAAKAAATKAEPARGDTKPAADAARVSALTSGSSIETGYIRVVTDKKCLVIVDGKQRGYAPNLGAIELSVGMHPVRCVVAGSGMSRSSEVRVDAGTLRAVEIRFGE